MPLIMMKMLMLISIFESMIIFLVFPHLISVLQKNRPLSLITMRLLTQMMMLILIISLGLTDYLGLTGLLRLTRSGIRSHRGIWG